jgi:hypothetical protein
MNHSMAGGYVNSQSVTWDKFCRYIIELQAVFRIHDILGWIRILGSMLLTNGSGSWIRILLFSSLTFKMPAKN